MAISKHKNVLSAPIVRGLRLIDPEFFALDAKLLSAIGQGDARAAAWAISAGADPNKLTSQGDLPLGLAARANDFAMASALMDAGASPARADGHGFTALMWAACGGFDCVELLLSRSDLMAKDARGMLAVHIAAWEERCGLDAFKLLLAATPQPSEGPPLTSWAAMCPRSDKLAHLLDAGADPFALDSQGRSALHMAAKHGRVASIDLLARAGAGSLALKEDGSAERRLPVEMALASRRLEAAAHLCRLAPNTIERALRYGTAQGYSADAGFKGFWDRFCVLALIEMERRDIELGLHCSQSARARAPRL